MEFTLLIELENGELVEITRKFSRDSYHSEIEELLNSEFPFWNSVTYQRSNY